MYLTDIKKKQVERDQRIYDSYQEMINTPGAMATKVEQVLMGRFKIKNRATIWRLLKRVQASQIPQAQSATTTLHSPTHSLCASNYISPQL